MTYQAYLSPFVAFWPDNVSDGEQAEWVSRTGEKLRYQLKSKKIDSVYLDNGDVFTPTFSGATTADWRFIAIKVTGTARAKTEGYDTNGSTPIVGYVPMYGVSWYPGIYLISTYNLTNFSITGQEDGTVVELFAALAEEDTEATTMNPTFVFQFSNWNPSSTTAGTTNPSAGSVTLSDPNISVTGPSGGTVTMTFAAAGTYLVHLNLSHRHANGYLDGFYFATTMGGTATRRGNLSDSMAMAYGVDGVNVNTNASFAFVLEVDAGETLTIQPVATYGKLLGSASDHTCYGSILIEER